MNKIAKRNKQDKVAKYLGVIGGIILLIGAYTMFMPAKVNLENPTYLQDIKPVIQQKCISCHGPEGKQKMIYLDTYEKLMLFVKPGDNKSVLVTKTKQGGNMSIELTPDESEMIKVWVEQGAKEK